MPGGRARVGIIVPANNGAIEYDFWNMAPEGVTIHSTRMPSVRGDEPYSAEEISNFKSDLKNSVGLLDNISDVIVYGRTYGSRYHSDIIKGINPKIILPEDEVVNELKENDAKHIYIITPYNKKRTLNTVEFFESKSFYVDGYMFMDKVKGIDISNTHKFTTYRFIKKALPFAKDSDAIYVASTALPTSDVIRFINEDMDKPVVTENIAAFREALKSINIKFNYLY